MSNLVTFEDSDGVKRKAGSVTFLITPSEAFNALRHADATAADTAAPRPPVDLEAVAARLEEVATAAGSPLTVNQAEALGAAARLLRGEPVEKF